MTIVATEICLYSGVLWLYITNLIWFGDLI